MKRILQVILAAIGLSSGVAEAQTLPPRAFALEFVEALKRSSPEINVTIVNDFELKLSSDDGRTSVVFLDNAYDQYKQDTAAKSDVIRRFVASTRETYGKTKLGLDSSRIIPVIKDKAWLEDTRQGLQSRGFAETPEYVYEEFNSDLVVVYAEDTETNIRYFGPKDLLQENIDKSKLRSLAIENLKRLLPKIERHGTNGFYMYTAGGDYEASLLTFDSIWSDLKASVNGEVVVAIPARDLLLTTGSQDAPGIEKLKRMVKEASSNGSYRLTQKLFVYRNGKFVEFVATN